MKANFNSYFEIYCLYFLLYHIALDPCHGVKLFEVEFGTQIIEHLEVKISVHCSPFRTTNLI